MTRSIQSAETPQKAHHNGEAHKTLGIWLHNIYMYNWWEGRNTAPSSVGQHGLKIRVGVNLLTLCYQASQEGLPMDLTKTTLYSMSAINILEVPIGFILHVDARLPY